MAVEVLDAVVEATKFQEKNKSFKDVVDGGRRNSPEDILMAGTNSNMPISNQPATGACTSNQADKKLRNGCLEKIMENLRYEVTSPFSGKLYSIHEGPCSHWKIDGNLDLGKNIDGMDIVEMEIQRGH